MMMMMMMMMMMTKTTTTLETMRSQNVCDAWSDGATNDWPRHATPPPAAALAAMTWHAATQDEALRRRDAVGSVMRELGDVLRAKAAAAPSGATTRAERDASDAASDGTPDAATRHKTPAMAVGDAPSVTRVDSSSSTARAASVDSTSSTSLTASPRALRRAAFAAMLNASLAGGGDDVDVVDDDDGDVFSADDGRIDDGARGADDVDTPRVGALQHWTKTRARRRGTRPPARSAAADARDDE